jgi:phenylpyruvate tautomerase PptA (4-oxalocrotonate tautomerase family)
MPLYRLSIPSGSLALAQRAQIAEAITEIHCDVTGAPALFVHVFFFDAPASGAGPRHQVHGTIRAGRTPKQKQELRNRMRDSVARIAGCAPEDVAVSTSDTPARWVMEGGVLLPEPGEEKAWLSQHAPSGSA